jgi:hypothetical protein
MYNHPSELSIKEDYQIAYQLLTADGKPIEGRKALSEKAGGDVNDLKDPNNFKFADNKTIALASLEEEVILEVTFQTY